MFDGPGSIENNDSTPPKPPRPPRHSAPPLSPTEKKVGALLLQRMTEQRIAEHLERSPNTIHVHVRNIYRKLGIRSRRELFAYPGIVNLLMNQEKTKPSRTETP